LFGAPEVFLGAVALGLATLTRERRRVVWRLLLINAAALSALVLYVSHHPADVILRLWLPLVVLVFGLVGQALWFAAGLVRDWLRLEPARRWELNHCWPLILLLVLGGYAAQMNLRGAEQIEAMVRHLRERQPLALSPAQPELLLARARPGDRVLYSSFILMPYYFSHGALQLGAVYYHPSFAGLPRLAQRLADPALRFAVVYHPTVYHPAFQGLDERTWWPTAPDLRFSPLNQRRPHGPAAREGIIYGGDYRRLEFRVREGKGATPLQLYLHNSGEPATLKVVQVLPGTEPHPGPHRVLTLPVHLSGRYTVHLGDIAPDSVIRLIFPENRPSLGLGGVACGDETLQWPWSLRATLTLYPRDCQVEPFEVSFDPRDLLPPPLRGRPVTVLDDRGSSVLLHLGP